MISATLTENENATTGTSETPEQCAERLFEQGWRLEMTGEAFYFDGRFSQSGDGFSVTHQKENSCYEVLRTTAYYSPSADEAEWENANWCCPGSSDLFHEMNIYNREDRNLVMDALVLIRS